MHFFPQLSQWMYAVPDARFQPRVIYHKRFLLWWGLSLFLLKLRSRRQLDFELRQGGAVVLANLNRLAGTQQKTLPVHDTLDYFLGGSGAEAMAQLRTKMMRRLLRMRVLEAARLQGYVVIAIDGTGWLRFYHKHCEECLVQHQGKTTIYLHQVLEAKLVTPWGLAISIETEFIRNSDWPSEAAVPDAEQRKQDCELKALTRLAPRLKQRFPQLRICLTGDGLYGCGPAIQLAQEYDWAYIFTFKPKRLPSVWQEYQSLLQQCPSQLVEVSVPAQEGQPACQQRYRWVEALDYDDSKKHSHTFNAFQCEETTEEGTTLFAWITNLRVDRTTVVPVATKGGRPRWKIENQGFNSQKNSDLNLEHAYGTAEEQLYAYYYLLQIAHLLLQLVEKGSLLRQMTQPFGKTPVQFFGSLKNIARRLLECIRHCVLPQAAFDLETAAHIQIRFDTS